MRTDSAVALRAAYKAKGWGPRDIGVRIDGSSIDVTIKNPAIPAHVASRMAHEHESISRCERSGEILLGGNTYVSIRYSDAYKAALAAPILPALIAAVEKVKTELKPGDTEMRGLDGYPNVWVGYNLSASHMITASLVGTYEKPIYVNPDPRWMEDAAVAIAVGLAKAADAEKVEAA